MRWLVGRRRSAPKLASLAWAMAAGLLGGCHDWGRFAPQDGGTDAGPDASMDASMDAADAAADAGCTLRRPPPRPAGEAEPGGRQVVFALRDMVIEQRPEHWKEIGYDLDGLCSHPPDAAVECLPPEGSRRELDGAGGIDNSFGHNVTEVIDAVTGDFEETVHRNQHNGTATFVLRVREWNGKADDPQVDVTVGLSTFGTPARVDGGRPDPMVPDAGPSHHDGGTPPLPRWDGRDYWWVRSDGFEEADPDKPLIHAPSAYVADGTIVARLPDDRPLVLGGADTAIILRVRDAVLTARMDSERERIERAILAGRWARSAVAEVLEYTGLCTEELREAALQTLDRYADVMDTRGAGGPGATCDAISFGVEMTGVRAHWGGLSDAYDIPMPCADGGS